MSSTDSTDGFLAVGFVARAHGLGGQVIVELTTNRGERVEPGSRLMAGGRGSAADPGGTAAPEERRWLEVTSAAPYGERSGRTRWLVSFAGVKGKQAADALRGRSLLAPPLAEPETLWAHELVGAEVVDIHGSAHGRVTALQENPASDLLVLDDDTLVPLHFVISTEAGRVVVDVPEGLFDL